MPQIEFRAYLEDSLVSARIDLTHELSVTRPGRRTRMSSVVGWAI